MISQMSVLGKILPMSAETVDHSLGQQKRSSGATLLGILQQFVVKYIDLLPNDSKTACSNDKSNKALISTTKGK